MKNLRNFIMAFVGFIAVAMCVTSCLSNEDDSLDYATQKQYQQVMEGPQTGKIRFYRQQGTRAYVGQQTLVKYDSIPANWYIGSDSTITINNFPVYMLYRRRCREVSLAQSGYPRYEGQPFTGLYKSKGYLRYPFNRMGKRERITVYASAVDNRAYYKL